MALRFQDDFLKKLEYLHVVSRREFAGQNRADRRTPKRGRGIEVADHRPYTPGDDFRHIDWNTYRRLNRLLLRMFDEEQDLPIYLVLDVSASMAEPAGILDHILTSATLFEGLQRLAHAAYESRRRPLDDLVRQARGETPDRGRYRPRSLNR